MTRMTAQRRTVEDSQTLTSLTRPEKRRKTPVFCHFPDGEEDVLVNFEVLPKFFCTLEFVRAGKKAQDVSL